MTLYFSCLFMNQFIVLIKLRSIIEGFIAFIALERFDLIMTIQVSFIVRFFSKTFFANFTDVGFVLTVFVSFFIDRVGTFY